MRRGNPKGICDSLMPSDDFLSLEMKGPIGKVECPLFLDRKSNETMVCAVAHSRGHTDYLCQPVRLRGQQAVERHL